MGNHRGNQTVKQAVEAATAVVFDFDGTLVDSNEIKWRGFEHVFAGFPAHMPAISAYCRANNHTIRGEKFRHVCEQILHLSYAPERERDLHQRYAAYTTDAVATAPEIPGAEAFLQWAAARRGLALLSSTPTAILLEILQRRGWQGFFQTVQGAPVVKRDWLASYQTQLGCAPADILFFGDTPEDAASARAFGCPFFQVGTQAADPCVPGIPDWTHVEG